MTRNPLGWLGFALLVALPAAAAAEVSDLPPLPERNPLRAPVEAKPVLPGDQPTVPWTETEIGAAAAKCKELLTGDPLDYELLPPIKEGLCGTPAPVLLRAVGHDPKVAIEPPATMSCPMADVLGEWLRDTVQPQAKALFGRPVVKIQNASSYVCRNRYGGGNTPLSEHALANAFDVSQFVLADGTRITVLDHWPHVATATTESAPASDAANGGESAPGGDNVVTPAKAAAEEPTAPPPVATEPDPKSRFVTFLFEDACRRFGTVLGPNANEAHKDHFHLDMKRRRKANFCE
ncbi:MAG: extensin family protein [Methyloceanibacter sp.]